MAQILPSTIDFLKSLKKNNDRDWFEKNRSKYEAAKANVEEFTTALITEFTKINPKLQGLESKNCVFRIYRDVRFSKNKAPYKTNMGAAFSEGGRKSVKAGYYVHIEPGSSFIGGGMWMPQADVLKKVRQEIDYNTATFQKILKDKKFKSFFGSLADEYKLVNPPKGYDKTLPHIELLKYTSFIVGVEGMDDKTITSKDFIKKCVEGYKILMPLINFLNTALD